MRSEKDMTLLRDWHPGIDIKGWDITEKLDGVRVRWDGDTLWTREGNAVCAPAWFTKGLPASLELDAEVHAGPSGFQIARKAVQYGPDFFVKPVRLCVFDTVCDGRYIERLQRACKAIGENAAITTAKILAPCDNIIRLLSHIQETGGEGLVVRSPADTSYRPGRSSLALRIV